MRIIGEMLNKDFYNKGVNCVLCGSYNSVNFWSKEGKHCAIKIGKFKCRDCGKIDFILSIYNNYDIIPDIRTKGLTKRPILSTDSEIEMCRDRSEVLFEVVKNMLEEMCGKEK